MLIERKPPAGFRFSQRLFSNWGLLRQLKAIREETLVEDDGNGTPGTRQKEDQQ